MSPSASKRARRTPLAGSGEYVQEFFELLIRVLTRSGHSPRRLSQTFRDVCSRHKEPKRIWDPRALTFHADVYHVITLWHTDPRYLDSNGQPIALALRGRGPSLSELIRRVLPSADPEVITRSLLVSKGISRTGQLYRPNGRIFLYPRNDRHLHGLNMLLSMLRTVERNLSGEKHAVLFNRAAMNPSFPVVKLPLLHARMDVRGNEFLHILDDWMSREAKKTSGGKRIRLGVGLFAFEEPVEPHFRFERKRGRRPALSHAPARKKGSRR